MNRYVLKINDATYVKSISWIAFEIPEIRTDNFDNAVIVTDRWLDEKVEFEKTRLDAIKLHFPHVKLVKIRIVIDE